MVQSERMGSVKQRWYRVYSPFAVDMITVKGFFYAHRHTEQMTICVQCMPDKKDFYAHGHTEASVNLRSTYARQERFLCAWAHRAD